jgi:hypothetical protein
MKIRTGRGSVFAAAFVGVVAIGLVGCVPPPQPPDTTTTTTTTTFVSCQPGTFNATDGNEPCEPAPPGTFVDTAGATAATPCAPGSFQAQAGQTSCELAPIGFYVDSEGATAATSCPDGETTLSTGSTSAADCDSTGPSTAEVTSGAVDVGPRGLPVAIQLTAAGTTGPLTWSVMSGALPPGLAMSPNGLITGTAPDAGSFIAEVQFESAPPAAGDSVAGLKVAALTEGDPICRVITPTVQVCTVTFGVEQAPKADPRPPTPNGNGTLRLTQLDGTVLGYDPVVGATPTVLPPEETPTPVNVPPPAPGFNDYLEDGEWVENVTSQQIVGQQLVFWANRDTGTNAFWRWDRSTGTYDGGPVLQWDNSTSWRTNAIPTLDSPALTAWVQRPTPHPVSGSSWRISQAVTVDVFTGERTPVSAAGIAALATRWVGHEVDGLTETPGSLFFADGGRRAIITTSAASGTGFELTSTTVDLITGAIAEHDSATKGRVCWVIAFSQSSEPIATCGGLFGDGPVQVVRFDPTFTTSTTLLETEAPTTPGAPTCGIDFLNPAFSLDRDQVAVTMSQPGTVDYGSGPVEACVPSVTYRVALNGEHSPVRVGPGRALLGSWWPPLF